MNYDKKNMADMTTVVIVTDYFKKIGFKIKNVKQIINNTVIFPTEYFSPIHYWGTGRVTSKTIAIHHYSGSWVENGQGVGNWHLFSRFGMRRELILRAPAVFLFISKFKRLLVRKK